MNELVSVIVPVYNVNEEVLSECLRRLVNQTYKNIEVIIVDDGSVNKCNQVYESFKMNDERIEVIRQANMGQSIARNNGMKIAKGEYFCFVDGDDFVSLDLISILMKNIKNFKADLSMCDSRRLYSLADLDTSCNNEIDNSPLLLSNESAIRLMINSDVLCAVWAKIYSRSLFENIVFPEGKFAEDMFVNISIFANAKCIIYDHSKLYCYNQIGESLTRSKFNLGKLSMVEAIIEWREVVVLKYPKLTKDIDRLYYISLLGIMRELVLLKSEEGKGIYNNYKKKLFNDRKYINTLNVSLKEHVKMFLIQVGLFPFFIFETKAVNK